MALDKLLKSEIGSIEYKKTFLDCTKINKNFDPDRKSFQKQKL
jgi:hypothetical protein